MLPEPVPPQQAAFDPTVAVRHSLAIMLFGRLASIATWLLLICITVAALAR